MAASFYKRSVNTQANMKSGNILTVTVSIQIRRRNILILLFYFLVCSCIIIGSHIHRFRAFRCRTELRSCIHDRLNQTRITFFKSRIKVLILLIIRIDKRTIRIQIIINQRF